MLENVRTMRVRRCTPFVGPRTDVCVYVCVCVQVWELTPFISVLKKVEVFLTPERTEDELLKNYYGSGRPFIT